MAERDKLNAIGKGSLKHQQDMEAMQLGAATSGSLVPAAPKAPLVDTVPVQAGETPEEASIPAQQAANLEAAKKNPGIQEKLNIMAKARAKFYGEGQ